MAYPIITYADIYDATYGRSEGQGRGYFGHLVIRDSVTATKDYLLIGGNYHEDDNLDTAIRLNKRQVKQVVRACQKWLARIEKKGAAK